ncbi:MAG: hypothetical protein R6U85_10800 [Salinivirgaceae bacterium]
MQKHSLHITAMTLCIVVLCCTLRAQNYEQVWPREYSKAEAFIENHHVTIKEVFHQAPVPSKVALAVVFPELIRFNTIRDFFETGALETVYVNQGLSSIDFSIGHFQMKPSFAEAIEKDFKPGSHTQKQFGRLTQITAIDLNSERSQRLNRLKSIKWQLIYLRAFVELMYGRFPNLIEKPDAQQVAFLAAAYNLGYRHSGDEIDNWITVPAFPNGKKAWTQQYAYADIAVYFYQRTKLPATN